jgi:hypothetical protein
MNSERKVTGRTRAGVWLLGVGLLLTMGVTLGDGQSGSRPTPLEGVPASSSTNTVPGLDENDPLVRSRQATQARSLATDRQKKLLADADKLVELSNELKDEVNRSSKNDLSLTVIKKAGEIEKLAHDMRERERN